MGLKRRKSNHGFWIGSMLAILLLPLGCDQSNKPKNTKPVFKAAVTDSHLRMIDYLKNRKKEILLNDPFFGRSGLDKAKAYREAVQSGDITVRVKAARRVGRLQLRVGDVKEAIETYTEIEKQFRDNEGFFSRENRVELLIELAVAYLRKAETENCLQCEDGVACLFPIAEKGIHAKKEGSTAAISYVREALSDPAISELDLIYSARWLWNVAAMTLGQYPDGVPQEHRIAVNRLVEKSEFPRMVNVALDKNLNTLSLSGGVICDDLDGNGTFDILISDWNPDDKIRWFSNDGKGNFEDRTDHAGLKGVYGGLNMVNADYDNDGDIDILVLRGAWGGENGKTLNSLLQNDGTGKFRDVTFDVGLGKSAYPTQTASWADFDLDGDLDLYIGNENVPCELFVNDGKGKFTEIAVDAGVTNNGFTKAVIWGDYNNDRYPDIYVSNYDTPNRLYKNNKDGTFTDVAREVGATGPKNSFPGWFWDYNNDGRLDLFIASYPMDLEAYSKQFFTPTTKEANRDFLYRQNEQGKFEEVGFESGLTHVTDPMGSNFGDLDNDGYLDFYLGTGAPDFEYVVPNMMYRNERGKRFHSDTFQSGLGHLQKGHGVVFADLDNDGDVDMFQVLGGAYPGDQFQNAYFENPRNDNRWLKIKLTGTTSNRNAIGARVKVDFVENGKPRSVVRIVNSGGTFGCNPFTVHVGLGKCEQIKKIEIYWPVTDLTQVLENVEPNQLLKIQEGKQT